MLIKVKLAGGGGEQEGRREQGKEGARRRGRADGGVANSLAQCHPVSGNATLACDSKSGWAEEPCILPSGQPKGSSPGRLLRADTPGFLLAPESPPVAPTGPPPSAPPSSASCAVESAQQKTKAAISATSEAARDEEQPCPFASSASVGAPGHPTQWQRAKCQQLPSSSTDTMPTRGPFQAGTKETKNPNLHQGSRHRWKNAVKSQVCHFP